MKIFVNDIPILLTNTSNIVNKEVFDQVFHDYHEVNLLTLWGNILIEEPGNEFVSSFLKELTDVKISVISITITSANTEPIIAQLKNTFIKVEAAGGVVSNENRILLINRLNKWDLPKGKIEMGERKKNCAIREVEEETGVKAEVVGKIGHTWHTYFRSGEYYLKKTNWYSMRCVNDIQLSPQLEEDITMVRWFDQDKMKEPIENSYSSIKFIWRKFLKR